MKNQVLQYDPLNPPKGDFRPVQVWQGTAKERLTTKILKSIPIRFNLENEITINIDDLSVTADGLQYSDTPVFTTAAKYTQPGSAKLKVYPNPAGKRLHIELSHQQQGKYMVHITDVAGRSVLRHQLFLPYERVPELPVLKPGLYFLILESGGKRFTEKITIR